MDSILYYLFVIKNKKQLYCFRMEYDTGNEYKCEKGTFVEILSAEEQINKEDIYFNENNILTSLINLTIVDAVIHPALPPPTITIFLTLAIFIILV